MNPLAFVCSENMVLGNQLLNRLQDLGYRAQAVGDPRQLLTLARTIKPFLIVTDLTSRQGDLLAIIKELREDESTRHIPVLGVTNQTNRQFHADAVSAGATLVAMESGILAQLPQLLDQALALD